MIGSVVLLVLGALVAVAGVVGALGRLRRNHLVGVRTPATMRSDEAFAAGNRAAGPLITLGGLAAVVGGAVALLGPAGARSPAVVAGVVAMGVLALVGGAVGNRAARSADPL